MEPTMSTKHIAVTNDNFPGLGYAVPTDWSEKVAKVEGENHCWTAYEVGDREATHLLLGMDPYFGVKVAVFTWGEDRNSKSFEEALAKAGYHIVEKLSGEEYSVEKNED